MCGVAGIVKFDSGISPQRASLKRMCDSLSHRGPDDEGQIVYGQAGLGHRRLSIIDIEAGHQPMSNNTGKCWISYNGELYNFKELRSDLEAEGCEFRTRSDTEVVLRCYEVYGDSFLGRLQGMFAFAIWDGDSDKLIIARDRLGIKPFYYQITDSEIIFASEIKGVLAAKRTKPAFNKEVLPEYLANGFVSGDRTFFVGIKKLLPGRMLTWSKESGLEEQRYWDAPTNTENTRRSINTLARDLRHRLADSVRSHLMSEVPLGVFLSGGLDSSGLAAIVTSMRTEPLCTFSVGFEEQGFSELDYARSVAEAIGSNHRDVVISSSDFFGVLPSLIWHEDEPIAFPSSIPLYFLSKLAGQYVKVVITGEGADELFLGYNRYRVAEMNTRLGKAWVACVPAVIREKVRRLIPRLPRKAKRIAERSFLARNNGIRDTYFENFSVFPESLRNRVLSSEIDYKEDPHGLAMKIYSDTEGTVLNKMMHADIETYLVELLMKQDQMSMAASIETRVPFLDHEFVEYAVRLPDRFKIRWWRTKAVLREAFRDLIPKEILTRKKMGFPVPVGEWLRTKHWKIIEDFVISRRAMERGLFDPEVLTQLAEDHRTGKENHGDRLWLLVGLEIWQRIYIDGETALTVGTRTEEAA